MPQSRTTTTVDKWGSPTQIIAETLTGTTYTGSTLDSALGTATGYSKTTNNEYWDDADKWWIGRLKKSTVTSTRPAN